jgi:hypothetical protein
VFEIASRQMGQSAQPSSISAWLIAHSQRYAAHARVFAERRGGEMRRNLSRPMCGFAGTFLAATLVTPLRSEAFADGNLR